MKRRREMPRNTINHDAKEERRMAKVEEDVRKAKEQRMLMERIKAMREKSPK